jgi:hypothetical protein
MSEHDIACQYFEHVAEYSVAACRECRYAVWPDQIEAHLQQQHKVSRKQAEMVGECKGLTLRVVARDDFR